MYLGIYITDRHVMYVTLGVWRMYSIVSCYFYCCIFFWTHDCIQPSISSVWYHLD